MLLAVGVLLVLHTCGATHTANGRNTDRETTNHQSSIAGFITRSVSPGISRRGCCYIQGNDSSECGGGLLGTR